MKGLIKTVRDLVEEGYVHHSIYSWHVAITDEKEIKLINMTENVSSFKKDVSCKRRDLCYVGFLCYQLFSMLNTLPSHVLNDSAQDYYWLLFEE